MKIQVMLMMQQYDADELSPKWAIVTLAAIVKG